MTVSAKKCSFAFLLLVLSGCTANLVKHPYEVITTSQYAPESEKQADGIGVVNYLNEGAESVRKARREDAYKKAYEACQGQYEILEETVTVPLHSSMPACGNLSISGCLLGEHCGRYSA